MPRGINSVAYKADYGVKDGESPQEWFEFDASGASRVIDVAWADRATAVAELLGYSTLDQTDPNDWKLHRYLPDFHPDFPLMIAKRCRVQGVGRAAALGSDQFNTVSGKRVAKYAKARLFVEYEFPDFDVLEDADVHDEPEREFLRYRTFEAHPSAEYLTPPVGAFLKWSQGPDKGQTFPGQIGRIVGTVDYHWTWLQVPFDGLPQFTINNTIGRVNKATFAEFAPHTLLLIGVQYRRVNSPFQARTCDVSYVARFNPNGHNKFFDFRHNEWYQASVDGQEYTPGSVNDKKLLFDEREFLNLFDVNDPDNPFP